jgi:lipoprotein signal peptidase
MVERSYRALLWTLVLVGALTDQVSKYVVFRALYHEDDAGGQFVIVPGVFKLLAQFQGPIADQDVPEDFLTPLRTWSGPRLPRVNHGALFGIKLGLGDSDVWLANTVFAVVSFIAAAAIIYWSTRPATVRDPFLSAALGLILAGTLGNLYDRLIFHGVRDFLYFHWIEWPVFNVADCCLVCGAFLLLAQAILHRPATPAPERGELSLATVPAEAK